MPKTLGLLRLLLLSTLLLSAGTAAEPNRTTLHGHVPRGLSRLAPVGALPPTTNLTLAIGLPARNQPALEELLRQLQDPHSTNFHQYLTPEQFAQRFGPTEQEYDALIQFAKSNGFAVVDKHPNRLVLEVEASARNIERAFQVSLRTYKHPAGGREFYAPDTEPSVPANLPACAVEGLSDFWRPQPLARPAKALPPRPLYGSGPSGLYAGKDFRNAYVPGTTLTGAGQAVGLLEFSGYFQVDITNYQNTIGLTNYVPLVNVVVGHGSPPGTANNTEVALDIEMAIAMAPGLSKVIVYEQSSINPSTILSRMANDNLAKQLSSSWAWGGGPSSIIESIFRQMAAQGQSFFQSSGDSDAYTGANLLDNANATVTPVDSPNVTCVGGTSLNMNGSGLSWASESVWNYNDYGGSFANVGSGGGISSYYSIPSWQTNVSMAANAGSTLRRNIPDVALTADQIYAAYNNGSSGGVAGTSCAAPLWAGFCALANQASVASGHAPVGFLNPALYNIARTTNYAACFHDVTTGDNIGTNTPGLFNAVPGYDLCTGLGTPNGPGLINALVPYPQIAVPPVAQTVQCGSDAAFSLTATGASPLRYQWSLDGAALPGATNSSLALTNVHLPAHTISVVVTNLYGAATSSVALAVQDTLPPVLMLLGGNPLYVELGNAFADPGATAYDTCAGALPVTVSGTVNPNMVGTNTLAYSANDGNANSATALRLVIVRDTTPPAIAWSFTNLVLVADAASRSALMPDLTGTNSILASDLSGPLTISQNPANGTALPLGINQVVLTVLDAFSNAARSTNTVEVVMPVSTNVVPAITSAIGGPAQTLLLELTAGPGSTCVLETSPALDSPAAWSPLATNTLGPDGTWHFTDTLTNTPRQFYRLRLVP